MENILQDVRYGLRILFKRPGFTSVAVLTIALGIGANTAIFSIVNAVLLRPLPYSEPDRLVQIWEARPSKGINKFSVTPRDYTEWVKQQQCFDDAAAFRQQYFTITGVDEPERILGAVVSSNLFATVGVSPIRGRVFLPEEDSPDRNRVVILAHGLWQRRFGADPSLIGQNLNMDGNAYTVVGVMPPKFEFPIAETKTEVWIPIAFRPAEIEGGGHNTFVVARRKRGETLAQAQAEMNTIASGLEQQYPQTNAGITVKVISLHEQVVGRVQTSLLILLSAVGLVLLIACANVANLLLARNSTRRKEIAIRIALGAGRARIVRQLLTESILLAGAGGFIGVLLAFLGVYFLIAISPPDIARAKDAYIDARVLSFAVAMSLSSGLIFGLLPSLQASKGDLNKSLKEAAGTTTASPGNRRFGDLLLTVEVMLSLVLLAGAGLMIKSFVRLRSVESGINSQNLLTMQLSLPASRYREASQQVGYYREVLERIRATPGVRAAAATSNLPLTGGAITDSFTIEGRSSDSSEPLKAGSYAISPDYFQTMGITVLKGRDFMEQDSETASKVVIINQAAANHFWPAEDPIGRWLTIAGGPKREIVGVAADAKRSALDSETQSELFVPYSQSSSFQFGKLVVRTISDPASLISELRKQILALDRNQAVYNIKPMDQLLSESVAERQFNMLLLSIFSVLSLVLAAVGVYSVVGFTVIRHMQELGIRIALGARTRDVIALVTRWAMIPVLAGVAIGMVVALISTRVLSSLLFQVSSTDPSTFVVVAVLMVGVTLLACYFPTRRALKADPVVAIRHE